MQLVGLTSGPVECDSVSAGLQFSHDSMAALEGRTEPRPGLSVCLRTLQSRDPDRCKSISCFLLVCSGLFLDSSCRDGSPDPMRMALTIFL